jgi:WD40 repeat protein
MQLASCSHDTTIKLWNIFDDGKKKITSIKRKRVPHLEKRTNH